MKYLIAAACVVVIAASGNYLWAQYEAAQVTEAAKYAAVIEVRATAQREAEYEDYMHALKERDQRVAQEQTDPCIVPVSRLRAIQAARSSEVAPVYGDNPKALRAAINGCIEAGRYTRNQVSDVLAVN